MERRKFIKLGLLTIPSMYLFPKKLLGVDKQNTPTAGEYGKASAFMPDLYSGRISGHDVLMPENCVSIIKGKQVYMVVPDQMSVLGIIAGDDKQNRLLRDLEEIAAVDRKTPFFQAAKTEMKPSGQVSIPDKIKKVSAVRPGEVAVVHPKKKDLVQMYEKELFGSEKDSGLTEVFHYYIDSFEYFVIRLI